MYVGPQGKRLDKSASAQVHDDRRPMKSTTFRLFSVEIRKNRKICRSHVRFIIIYANYLKDDRNIIDIQPLLTTPPPNPLDEQLSVSSAQPTPPPTPTPDPPPPSLMVRATTPGARLDDTRHIDRSIIDAACTEAPAPAPASLADEGRTRTRRMRMEGDSNSSVG